MSIEPGCAPKESTLKHHQHRLVVKKNEHNKSHFSSCEKKVEAAKEEGTRDLSKQFYVLASCHIDFMMHFYWLVSKRGS